MSCIQASYCNPDLKPAVYMLDKDKSEHDAAGSVLVESALTGIQAAVEQLTSLQTADFESLWQSSIFTATNRQQYLSTSQQCSKCC